MTRWAVLFGLLVLAAGSLAQDADSVPLLVKQLGADEYEVRERATSDLIALGEKAVPALERALESEDLEVRLRAGRALRTIRRKKNPVAKPAVEDTPSRDAAEPPPPPSRPAAPRMGRARSVEVTIENGKAIVKLKTFKDGKEETRTYEGESLEQLRRKYPELRDVLGDVRVFSRRGDSFDLDSLWRTFGRGLDDKDWQTWAEETRQRMDREMARFQQLERDLRQRWNTPQWRAETAGGPRLGAYVATPDQVVDAQLGLDGGGLVIRQVDPRSLAERLGLRRFDILLEFNGTKLAGRRAGRTLQAALRARKEGEKAKAVILRRAQRMELVEK